MPAPPHIDWLEDTGETFETADGQTVEVWDFNYKEDEDAMKEWAKHFREHYCSDDELPFLVDGTGKTKSQFLNEIKFPDRRIAPGPSTRSGDFAEILVADFIEYILGYWSPRQVRYEDRMNRNVSTNGCDILGLKFVQEGEVNEEDELFLLESKASFRRTADNRLQDAIDDSIKDMAREGMSLSAIKQRLRKKNLGDAEKVQRFQLESDRPFRRISGAAAVLEDDVYDEMELESADASHHPNVDNLRLIVIKGVSMMSLVHKLYEVAADEA
ncbi:MAG: DUF1837 domain-containing protein [Mesorhizobium sp.]|nr:MAG: DUF1837 domain-containing protein [Mesorhizobium sp.]